MTNPAANSVVKPGIERVGAAATRLAPSPTGTLHLGNLRTFAANWALARQCGWSIILRIEDLDRSRVRPDADRRIIEAFAWLGLEFDSGPTWQSHDLQPYAEALRTLALRGMAYECQLTRREIMAASSAPHTGEQELRYPPELRPRQLVPPNAAAVAGIPVSGSNYRFATPDEPIVIDDCFAGRSTHHPAQEVGDFIIWTRLGVPSYQLAVVVDDAQQGVTDVVRGDDLLPSAARQVMLYRALDLTPPRWWHLPLVLDELGRRLAKRSGDVHVDQLRARGVRSERVLGLLGRWCGIGDEPSPIQELDAAEFLARFDLARLERTPIHLTTEHLTWLLER